MKQVVEASLEDAGGDRCVDLIRGPDGWSWVECRRDPEDTHGWRRLHPPRAGFADQAAAKSNATLSVGWLKDA